MKHTLSNTVFLLGLLFCGAANAIDYQIEVALIENVRGSNATLGSSLYFPRLKNAVGLSSDDAADMGFALVPDADTLGEYVDKVKESGSYRLLRHFAWRQPGLDNDSAQAIRINVGKALSLYIPENYRQYDKFIPASTGPTFDNGSRQLTTTTVNGTLKVRLGRFLHVDTNLVFTDINAKKSYRLDHSRKMRSRELHYIDNPRFGLLIRIVPLDE